LVKIFCIDYQTIGALLRWTNGKVGHIIHHLLHAEPIQFNTMEFLVAIVVSQSKRESQSCSLLSKTAHTLQSSYMWHYHVGILQVYHNIECYTTMQHEI